MLVQTWTSVSAAVAEDLHQVAEQHLARGRHRDCRAQSAAAPLLELGQRAEAESLTVEGVIERSLEAVPTS